MNATDRVLQCCAVAAIHVRQNAKSPWTTPFVPDTFFFSLYNLHGEKNFLGKLARNLACQELANARRLSHGMQLRLTNLGVKLARKRVQESAYELAAINTSKPSDVKMRTMSIDIGSSP